VRGSNIECNLFAIAHTVEPLLSLNLRRYFLDLLQKAFQFTPSIVDGNAMQQASNIFMPLSSSIARTAVDWSSHFPSLEKAWAPSTFGASWR
jgi:hypothetical protein